MKIDKLLDKLDSLDYSVEFNNICYDIGTLLKSDDVKQDLYEQVEELRNKLSVDISTIKTFAYEVEYQILANNIYNYVKQYNYFIGDCSIKQIIHKCINYNKSNLDLANKIEYIVNHIIELNILITGNNKNSIFIGSGDIGDLDKLNLYEFGALHD